MKLNIAIFSYSRLNGLLNILEQALIHSKLISKIIIITNGDYPSRFEMNKFPKEIEFIILAKQGCFDSSILFFHDIVQHWEGYTYLCGDDDLPDFPVLYYAINEGLSNIPSETLPDVIGFNQPSQTSLGLQNCENAEARDIINRLANNPISHQEMLLFFSFSLSLGSFMLCNEKIRNCPRETLKKSIGTWHTYSILAFEMASESTLKIAKAKPYLWMNLTKPIEMPQNRKWTKTYSLNHEMVKSLTDSLKFINLNSLSPEIRKSFTSNFQQVINSWAP